MIFEEGYLYHIFNQGNNHEQIYFSQENYYFFLRKLKTYISPYADILAWCLMPNHFHLMVSVHTVTVGVDPNATVGNEPNATVGNEPNATVGVASSDTDSCRSRELKQRTFNQSIGIMLRSYTSAINKQRGRSGKLIREKTKAECINKPNGVTPSFITKQGGCKIKISNPEKEYPQVCFNYIHQNPVKAGLCQYSHQWKYSSALDYAGARNGKLINKDIAKNYVNW